jgi:hypothetical protein
MNARRLALIALVAAHLVSSAAANTPPSTNVKWSFQRTGFRSSSSQPQTALSMRNNLSWPVVYGIDAGMLNAYSLFPFPNTGPIHFSPPTNWHQIGANLTGSPVPSSNIYLQAASGSPDGFGVSVQTPFPTGTPQDTTVLGTSMSGFQPPLVGTQAVKYDSDGDPFTASNATIPGLPTNQKLFDVALSGFGEVGAVTQSPGGSGPVTFWQQSPLLGGRWLSIPLPFSDPRTDRTLFGPTIDLAYDTSSRPHIIGIDRQSSLNAVAAFRFDIPTGAWVFSTLDTVTTGPPIGDVAAAANDQGIVAAAWVNSGALKYAYMDTNETTPQWVVTTVASATPTGRLLETSQGVGLAFDKWGLPVISFVEQGLRQIWIAYDPPSLTTAPTMPVAGDFNGDGLVDGNDLEEWQLGFGDGSGAADADGDGDSDGSDFLAWQRNLSGDATPAASAAIPEPATLSIFLVAASFLVGTSRLQAAHAERRIKAPCRE